VISGRGRGVEAIFAALADPTRRTVLDQLAEVGPMSATQLAARFPVSRQAVVKHLTALSGAGLVTSVREGREVRYQVAPGSLEEAVSWLVTVGQRWDRRLAALSDHLGGLPIESSPVKRP
jgi:DNA-binding transcriptional ArsR family regulator